MENFNSLTKKALSHVGWNISYSKFRKIITNSILLGGNPNTTQYENSGKTPLFEAVCNNDLELANFLLDKGANPNQRIEGIFTERVIFCS